MKLVFGFCLLILQISLYANNHITTIDKKIKSKKAVLSKKKQEQKYTKQKIDYLVKIIQKKEDELDELNQKITTLSNSISLNRFKLQKAKKDLKKLEDEKQKIDKKIKTLQDKIVKLVINRYTMILNKKFLNKQTFEDVIKEEIYKSVLEDAKEELNQSNIIYLASLNQQRKIKLKQQVLKKYIASQEKQKAKLTTLLATKEVNTQKLKNSYEKYQKKLEQIIQTQSKLNSLLGELKILKVKEIKKEKIAKLKQRFNIKKTTPKPQKTQTYKEIKIASKKDIKRTIDMKVKSLGDSTKGVKISRFRGRKTIPPLKRYTLEKGFGTYLDPVYKIKLFNDGVTLRSKQPNAKVYSVLNGKVVYAKKDAGILGNVVILKHSNNLHTIYSHLEQIAPIAKKGKWIKKGSVIGRVKEKLVFQVTRNNSYINPMELIK